MTAKYGPRLVEKERCAYLRPTVVHCESPATAIAKKEYMFPFVTVVECPQEKMLEAIGPTLVCTAITERPERSSRQLTDATHIDRLNIGPIPTIKLDWLQPHEGNIVEFLFRARAYQIAARNGWRSLKTNATESQRPVRSAADQRTVWSLRRPRSVPTSRRSSRPLVPPSCPA